MVSPAPRMAVGLRVSCGPGDGDVGKSADRSRRPRAKIYLKRIAKPSLVVDGLKARFARRRRCGAHRRGGVFSNVRITPAVPQI